MRCALVYDVHYGGGVGSNGWFGHFPRMVLVGQRAICERSKGSVGRVLQNRPESFGNSSICMVGVLLDDCLWQSFLKEAYFENRAALL